MHNSAPTDREEGISGSHGRQLCSAWMLQPLATAGAHGLVIRGMLPAENATAQLGERGGKSSHRSGSCNECRKPTGSRGLDWGAVFGRRQGQAGRHKQQRSGEGGSNSMAAVDCWLCTVDVWLKGSWLTWLYGKVLGRHRELCSTAVEVSGSLCGLQLFVCGTGGQRLTRSKGMGWGCLVTSMHWESTAQSVCTLAGPATSIPS